MGLFSSPDELSGQVEEGLFEVVAALRENLIVLEVLLPVEGHLPVLGIDLVLAEYNRDALARLVSASENMIKLLLAVFEEFSLKTRVIYD